MVPVRIAQRELARAGIRIHVRLLVEPIGQATGALEAGIEIVDAEERRERR
jgi:hypothetical protein